MRPVVKGDPAVNGRPGVIGRLRATIGDQVLIGLSVVLVAVLVMASIAIIYLRPPSQTQFRFLTTDASAISSGTDVRVAGVSVGQITDVEIVDDEVAVTASVKDTTFIGDLSRVEVRMLTPVGGFAVSLIPLGSEPLGDRPIPQESVTVPYTIADVLQVAPKVTDEIAGEPVDANLAEVADALSRNPDSITDIAAGTEALTRVLDRQEEQVRTIMTLSAEYLQNFNANREFVFDLVRQIDIVVETYHVNSAGFNEAYALLGDVLMRLQPFEAYYLDNADLVSGEADNLRETIADLSDRMGPALDNLIALRDRLTAWLTPEGIAEIGGGVLTADQICLPAVGKDC